MRIQHFKGTSFNSIVLKIKGGDLNPSTPHKKEQAMPPIMTSQTRYMTSFRVPREQYYINFEVQNPNQGKISTNYFYCMHHRNLIKKIYTISLNK